MYTKLNNIFNIIIKGLYETSIIAISSILLVHFFAGIDDYLVINRIIILSIVNYLCVYALNAYVFKGTSLDNIKKVIFIFLAAILSIISALITSKNIFVFYIITYLLIWYKSIMSFIDERGIYSNKKTFIITFMFFLGVVFILNLFDRDSITTQNLKLIFPMYLGVSLSYFASSNLEAVYNKRSSNSLNKGKNIKIINVISNALILLILIFTLTGFFGVWEKILSSNIIKSIWLIIQKIIGVIIYPVLYLLSKIINLIFRKADFSILEKLNSGEVPEDVEKITRNTSSSSTHVILEYIANIVKLGIAILIIYIIIMYIIKAISNKKLSSDVVEDEEEKEFVLSSKDISKRMKKSINRLLSNASMIFSKNKNNSNYLPIIRLIYLDTLLKLKEEGHEFSSHYTPNEFLSTLEDTKYVNTGIHDLTQVYNDFRYGGIEPTEEEIKRCTKVKNNIVNISQQK